MQSRHLTFMESESAFVKAAKGGENGEASDRKDKKE